MQIILALIIFIDIIEYLVLFDVITSWLIMLGINFRPKFVSDIMNPIYDYIKKILPTTIGPIDFTPIVVILLCSLLRLIIFIIFPDILNTYN